MAADNANGGVMYKSHEEGNKVGLAKQPADILAGDNRGHMLRLSFCVSENEINSSPQRES